MFQGQSPMTPPAYFTSQGDSHYFLKGYKTISSPHIHMPCFCSASLLLDYFFYFLLRDDTDIIFVLCTIVNHTVP